MPLLNPAEEHQNEKWVFAQKQGLAVRAVIILGARMGESAPANAPRVGRFLSSPLLAGVPRRMFHLQSEHPRARRYPLVASIELTDVESETQIYGHTIELSLFGCRVSTRETLPPGGRVRVRIVHTGAHFEALGRVVYVRQNAGMGIAFTKIELNHETVLEKWVDELRHAHP